VGLGDHSSIEPLPVSGPIRQAAITSFALERRSGFIFAGETGRDFLP
jgi:hypothetical protein